MKSILINGYFHCRKLNGVERYAFEITKRLDKIIKPEEISIIVPKDAENIYKYNNIKVIRYGKKIQHILWQMFTLQFFLLTHKKYIILDFGNTALPLSPGFVFLHDIYCELFPEDFVTFKEKIVRLYNRWQYRLIAKKAKIIATVSEYCKDEISKIFKIAPEKINVIYSSADHMKEIIPDNSVYEDFPVLKNKPFYFSLGSLSKRKNLKWIIAAALNNPDVFFAISGSSLSTLKVRELNNSIPSNIILLGYLNDEKVKALMQQCKAFILPSYYEGFGLTPLEALICGAKVIVSTSASLPEIYGKYAYYLNPYDTELNLENLLKEPLEKPNELFEKYSYDNAAVKVYNIINEFVNNNI